MPTRVNGNKARRVERTSARALTQKSRKPFFGLRTPDPIHTPPCAANFGGVQRMVLSGIAAGFLLFLVSKITGDLSKASLLAPELAATLPPFLGGAVGVLALLYQEDG